MKITELRPMLWTEDLKGAVDFYVDVLGFTCGELNEDWGWASLRLDAVAIMLARPFESVKYEKLGFTGWFYFNTDDVDAFWKKLKDKARLCYGIENFHYGMREFAIYDNNGYLLQFGQEIAA
ncbi:MAG: VOC family protein [Pyrinomonadaceae bacterium]